MARRTLGEGGATAVSLTYALLHYSLLVACERCTVTPPHHLSLPYTLQPTIFLPSPTLNSDLPTCLPSDIAKAGETVQQASGLPLPVADAAFVAAFGGLCYAGKQSRARGSSTEPAVPSTDASGLCRCSQRLPTSLPSLQPVPLTWTR